ncbi:carbohydrate-binding module family 48 protein [Melanogaster broomeanus]|nr:carbohydrate-binding module family 48 protein [Melanogaster broomeanus]
MGNTTSNTNHNRPSRHDSPSRRHLQSASPSPNPNQPHPSLRTKKRSLELPDLALLSLTPVAPHHSSANSSPLSSYRQQQRNTSPIPIPIPITGSNNGMINNTSNTGTSPRGRQALPNNGRGADTSSFSTELLLDQPPSTHIPVPHHDRGRGHRHLRGAPLQYNSTHSFASRGQAAAQPRMQQLYLVDQAEEPEQPDHLGFVPETVHSTIPLALHKAEDELAASTTNDLDEDGQPMPIRAIQPLDEPGEHVNVQIIWHGRGKSVALARAGDDNWKGRTSLEPDDHPTDSFWSTWVSLMPGTHHIRFIVDEQWRLADDLPTAVDDEGSLANYITVPVSGLTPPHATAIPVTPAKHPVHPHVHSFWSATTSTHGSMIDPRSASDITGASSKWTDKIPPELVAAAGEEEAYLSYTAGTEYDQSGHAINSQPHVPAPNIPPAPVLPRHLDKLILNTKVGPPPSTRGRERQREREREREREHRRQQGRSLLGMTSTVAQDIYNEDADGEAEHTSIPITTASGTNVTTAHLTAPSQNHTRLGLEGPGLMDDASVLPVPSHVILHHLSTSAIRNGVLAVGNTTRYRQKYLTTIYYKPT